MVISRWGKVFVKDWAQIQRTPTEKRLIYFRSRLYFQSIPPRFHSIKQLEIRPELDPAVDFYYFDRQIAIC